MVYNRACTQTERIKTRYYNKFWAWIVVILGLIVITSILSGCRLTWYKDLLHISVGEETVKQLDYFQDPNGISFRLINYDAGEKIVPSATSLIFGDSQ